MQIGTQPHPNPSGASDGTKTVQRPTDRAASRRLPRPIAALLARLATRQLPGQKSYAAQRPNVLVVSHEGSRTGAPIVAQNLVAQLSERYNVVVLCLRGGTLVEAFCQGAISVHVARRFVPKPLRAPAAIAALTDLYDFRFALVNSAESHRVARPLSAAGVPIVALVHEFVAYLLSHDRIRHLFDAARLLVFSSALTRDDAARRIGFGPDADVVVIPQGKCVVPDGGATEAKGAEAAVRAAMRPEGDKRAFVVLGAGTINYRKGVDLFIATLARLKTRAPDVPWRFVWIGGSLKLKTGDDYTVYLADQIERSGVSDDIAILPATSAIEAAYATADVFLLPSRLDPLPNVGIDAMAKGLPVLCFDRTTGMAELLRDAEVAEACVAPYLDIEALADRLIAFATIPIRREEVGRRLAAFANTKLQIDHYADTICGLIEAKLPTPS
ncbi:glycosyltransferase family 4 protein [Tabrizicola sp.]|uniref:glycosyltransferase family 4 protein n=1 Tax=Tabrizicola sp. TaxID=2005166 RepID=UPI003F2AF0D7